MPTADAWLRADATEFYQHRCDMSACAPGRQSVLTGCYTHNHNIGAGNRTDDYYDYCVDGKLVGSRRYGPWERTVDTGVSITGIAVFGPTLGAYVLTVTTSGPHGLSSGDDVTLGGITPSTFNSAYTGITVLNSTQFQCTRVTSPGTYVSGGIIFDTDATGIPFYQSSGSLPNWLKAMDPSIKTGFYGKYQNAYADYDNRGTGTAKYFPDNVPQYLNSARRIPQDWDDWNVNVGGIQTDVENKTSFYGLTVDSVAWASTAWKGAPDATGSGLLTVTLHNATNSVLAGKTGDTMVLHGAGVWSGAWIVDDRTSFSVYKLRAPTNLGTYGGTATADMWTNNGGNQDNWFYTMNKNGKLVFHDALSGVDTNDGSTPLLAKGKYEVDTLADDVVAFINARTADESFYMHICPQIPHLGPTNLGAKAAYQGTADFNNYSGYNGVMGATAPTVWDRNISAVSWSGGTLTITLAVASGQPSSKKGFLRGIKKADGTLSPVNGYYASVTRDNPTGLSFSFAVASNPGAFGTPDGSWQFITEENLLDWQQRVEKLKSVDDLIASIKAALTARGWADTTTIILSSDNGLQLGEHGEIEGVNSVWGNSKALLWDASERTPLIMRHPTIAKGQRRYEPTSVIDIPLTILDLFGFDDTACINKMGHNPHKHRDGRSVIRLLRGDDIAKTRALYLIGEFHSATQQKGIVDGNGRKLLYYGANTAVYDTIVDPAETTDLNAASTFSDGTSIAAWKSTMATRLTNLDGSMGDACRSA